MLLFNISKSSHFSNGLTLQALAWSFLLVLSIVLALELEVLKALDTPLIRIIERNKRKLKIVQRTVRCCDFVSVPAKSLKLGFTSLPTKLIFFYSNFKQICWRSTRIHWYFLFVFFFFLLGFVVFVAFLFRSLNRKCWSLLFGFF